LGSFPTRPGRQRAADERPSGEDVAELVHRAPRAEAGDRREKSQGGDDAAENDSDRIGAGEVRDAGCRQEPAADEVREARRARVLERSLAEPWLDHLEVEEARQAIAPAERQPDRKLGGEEDEQPPWADCDRHEREAADHRLVGPRRTLVDHRRVPVRVGRTLHDSLHLGKYYQPTIPPRDRRIAREVGRFAPAALVAVLLVATAAAFAYTERLKLTPSPILGTLVPTKVFSPVCECPTDTAQITFRLRRRDPVPAPLHA